MNESCFQDCCKVSPVVPVCKNFGERSVAKNCYTISRLSMVSKAFEEYPLDIPKPFDRICHAGLLHKCKSYRISEHMFGLLSFFLTNRQVPAVLDRKSWQEYPVNAGVSQDSICGPTLFCYTLMFLMLSLKIVSMLMIILQGCK